MKAQERELESAKKKLENAGDLRRIHTMKQDMLKAIGRAKHTAQRKMC